MHLITAIGFLLVVQWANGSPGSKTLFAAHRTMMETVESEHKLLRAVEKYSVDRYVKWNTIKRLYDQWEESHYESQRNFWKKQPALIPRFKLIQRITRLWEKIKTDFLDRSTEQKELEAVYARSLIPQVSDVQGFTRLLLINAETYHKSIDDILAPRNPYVTLDEILELSFRVKHHSLGRDDTMSLLLASDIALLGLSNFSSYQGVQITKMHPERWNLLYELTDKLYELGAWNIGNNICKKILELFPGDDEFSFKSEMFSDRLSRSNFQDKLEVDRSFNNDLDDDKKKFEWLCRRQQLVPLPSSTLKCYHYHKNHHLRHIAAYKVEEVSRSPIVRLYHDVLQDGEIRMLQKFAAPILDVAKVFDPKRETSKISDDRISSSAWFLDPERRPQQPPELAQLYRTLNQRMEDCTGLNRRGTEGIQMNNYGIGGHYRWHYDSLFYNAKLDYYPNDRVATWMFYLNDVKEGGNTVFPRLNISLPPRKGTAVFWYNLHPSGKMDTRTLHGGCPILQGNKWVANLWVGEFAQTFVRKCSLRQEEEEASSA